jgi:hypothetical protein
MFIYKKKYQNDLFIDILMCYRFPILEKMIKLIIETKTKILYCNSYIVTI